MLSDKQLHPKGLRGGSSAKRLKPQRIERKNEDGAEKLPAAAVRYEELEIKLVFRCWVDVD
jgi:hypothetical protein